MPILPLLPTPTIDTPEHTSPLPAPAWLFGTTPFPGRPPSQTIETPECTTALPRTESMTSYSFLQLKSIFSALFFLTEAAPDSHDAMLNTKRSTRTTLLCLLVVKVILSNLALFDLQSSKTNNLSLATMVISWLKCTLCTVLSQPWYQNILPTITLDLVGSVSVLGYYFHGNLALCNSYLYLLANAIQLAPAPIDQLHVQIAEIFKSAEFLSSLAACVDKNRGWFELSLLFKRVVFSQSDCDGSENNSRSNKGNGGGKSKIESDVKKRCVYRKDKELL